MAFTVGELLVATGPYTAESSPVYLADLEDVSDESPGEGQALVWDGEEWTFGDVGSMTSFTLAGDSGTNQTIADGNTLTILGGRGLATATSATDTITINLPTGTSGQVLKHNGTAWVAGTDTDTTYTAGTGLALGGTQFSLSHLGIQSLTDPGADRILFWDESENASKWLTIGTNLEISGTTLNASASAGITNFTLAGDSGTPQTISDGNTLTISGSGGITAVAGATDKVTIGLPSGSSGQVLKHNGSAWVAGTDTDTTYTAFTGDSGSGGAAGLVPAPGAGDTAAGKYLKASGGWATPPDTNTTYSAGTGLNLATTTFNHSNSVSAQSTARLDKIAYDAQGHVTSSSAAALGDLSNVNASSPSNGQVLKWNSTSSKWEAATDETGSGSLPAGTNAQTLRYNSSWEASSTLTNTGTVVTVTSANPIALRVTRSISSVGDKYGINLNGSNGDDDVDTYLQTVVTNDGSETSSGDFIVSITNGRSITERFRVSNTTLTNSSGKILTSAMADSLPTVVSAPAGSGSSGTANQIAFDSSYFYVCTGSNTWKRIAWTAW